MKYLYLLVILLLMASVGCNSNPKSNSSSKTSITATKPTDHYKDQAEIRTLVRNMLKWSDSKNDIQLLPALEKDSICIGFDFDKLNQTLEKLKKTGFFANEFIDNYSLIIHTLDKKIK